jgi:hypothetical protein
MRGQEINEFMTKKTLFCHLKKIKYFGHQMTTCKTQDAWAITLTKHAIIMNIQQKKRKRKEDDGKCISMLSINIMIKMCNDICLLGAIICN